MQLSTSPSMGLNRHYQQQQHQHQQQHQPAHHICPPVVVQHRSRGHHARGRQHFQTVQAIHIDRRQHLELAWKRQQERDGEQACGPGRLSQLVVHNRRLYVLCLQWAGMAHTTCGCAQKAVKCAG